MRRDLGLRFVYGHNPAVNPFGSEVAGLNLILAKAHFSGEFINASREDVEQNAMGCLTRHVIGDPTATERTVMNNESFRRTATKAPTLPIVAGDCRQGYAVKDPTSETLHGVFSRRDSVSLGLLCAVESEKIAACCCPSVPVSLWRSLLSSSEYRACMRRRLISAGSAMRGSPSTVGRRTI